MLKNLSPGLVVVAVVVVASVATLAACGSGPVAPPICPDDAPTGCPSPAPGFAADAAPIIGGHCVKCHVPAGMAEAFPFQSYDEIAPYAGDIKLQLETCAMPKPPEPPLTPAERQLMFGWILCGALND